ncbi:MAG: deoxyribodipyrimidine photo-lyase [Phycisphaerae bacterium]|nr:deoxyribodipyrimidine photo-lyase [Phycisphaerae bacterium]
MSSSASRRTILWFRRDLRLADHPALLAATQNDAVIIPTFIWSPDEGGAWKPGAAGKWWLHQSLAALDNALRDLGSRLIVRRGNALEELRRLAAETKAQAIYWSRQYEPTAAKRDSKIEKELREDGLEVHTFNGALLFEPWEIANAEGEPYQVFTAYWRNCSKQLRRQAPSGAPRKLQAPGRWPESVELEALQLEPSVDWVGGLRENWTPGEGGARAQLERFLDRSLGHYADQRNRPDVEGTSRLSPHLHLGEISPGQILHAMDQNPDSDGREMPASRRSFLSELGWREFAHHLLHHFPHTVDQPLRDQFAAFPWKDDSKLLRAWQKGRTGYPIVDAGMRELWTTGWMHNRVRMVAASFLVKDLLIPWQRGAEWFWDTLVDADLANNTLGWQWTAGCGADAAPYFRIFNPVSQGQKFDPLCDYVRKWVPELRELPDRYVHAPWEAPDSVLAEAGVKLGQQYPEPIVDHAEARNRALAAYEKIKKKSQ